MLGNPSNVGHAMMLSDSTDSAMWFSGSWQWLLQKTHLVHSTTMKATVDNVEIVRMHRWSWVLLMLLTVRVSVESATCVVSLAT